MVWRFTQQSIFMSVIQFIRNYPGETQSKPGTLE